MSRVLITGAGGFIGRNAVPLLLASGHEVHATTSQDAEASEQLVWHRVDLLDAAATEALIDRVRPELMLHLAWQVEPGRFWTSPENVRWVESSLALFRAFVASGGGRATFAGTCAEYDWNALPGSGVCTESETPLAPHTLYGACKRATHLTCEALAQESGTEFAWGRVFHLYGPGERPERLVPSVARSLLEGRDVATSDGGQIRDLSHVRDVAAAFVALLESEVQGPVNLATGEGVTIRSVIERIASELGRPELIRWGAIPRSESEPDVLVADVRRLNEEVGFHARTPLSEGLVDTVEWWRGQTDSDSGRATDA